MVLDSRKLGCVHTESWSMCLHLPFKFSLTDNQDSLVKTEAKKYLVEFENDRYIFPKTKK